MKKKIWIAAAALLLIGVLLTACSDGKKVDILNQMDVNEVAADLAQNGVYVDPLAEVDEEMAKMLYGLTKTVKLKVYASGGATPEEIIVAEYENDEDAKAGVTEIEARIQAQKEIYDTYNAQYRPLLDDVVMKRAGNYVIFCVSSDTQKALSIANSYIG